MAEAELFEQELKIFESRKDELLTLGENKFALIKGSELAGIFSNEEEAYREGLSRFGDVPFLIHPILREECMTSFPALANGLLRVSL